MNVIERQTIELAVSKFQEKACRVIARSTPIVKMRVVNALKSAGHVVAEAGDGLFENN